MRARCRRDRTALSVIASLSAIGIAMIFSTTYVIGPDGGHAGPQVQRVDVVGAVEATEAYLADYEARMDTLQALIAEHEPQTLSLVRVQNEDFIIYLPGTFGGTILTDAGLVTPQVQLDAGVQERDVER